MKLSILYPDQIFWTFELFQNRYFLSGDLKPRTDGFWPSICLKLRSSFGIQHIVLVCSVTKMNDVCICSMLDILNSKTPGERWTYTDRCNLTDLTKRVQIQFIFDLNFLFWQILLTLNSKNLPMLHFNFSFTSSCHFWLVSKAIQYVTYCLSCNR